MRTSSLIAKPLLRWYAARTRSLPWRERPEPYAVWVAEIMAQQTRLESMLPFYRRWLQRFPNVQALAAAPEQAVLSLWEGLGYYSRARNLRRAAQLVMKQHGGRLPSSAAGLAELPGIGPYTAGAIASLAFGEDVPAVDGNAVRVLARVFDVQEPADSGAGRARLWALAAQHLPPGQAAAYNQALMDLGASLCSPRQPACTACPLRKQCLARQRGVQAQRPVKGRAAATPLRNFAGAVVWQAGKVLVLQRPGRGLLAGMWEFPNTQLKQPSRAKAQLRRALQAELAVAVDVQAACGEYEHAYSHFRAHLKVYECHLPGRPAGPARPHKWLAPRSLYKLPMGKLDRRVANALLERHAA